MSTPRNVMLTMGHCPSDLWARCLMRINQTRTYKNVEQVFVYHHYPINKESNRRELLRLCEKAGVIVLDPGRNIGLHNGLNWAVEQLRLTAQDRLIGVDPDTFQVEHGWDSAFINVLSHGEHGWLCLKNSHTPKDLERLGASARGRVVNGVHVLDVPAPVVVSTCAFSMDWILSAGGFQEPCAYYGHLETAMFPFLGLKGKRMGVLPDYSEDDRIKALQDSQYAEWKHEHAFKGYSGNFCDFIRDRHPALL